MSDTDRDQFISGLYDLADMLENVPEMPLPTEGDLYSMCLFVPRSAGTDGVKSLTARLVRSAKSWSATPITKQTSDLHANLHLQFRLGGENGLKVALTTARDAVCTRRVVGSEIVVRTGKHPDQVAELPDVTYHEEVEVVEWECGSLLADDVMPEGEVSAVAGG